MRDDHAADWESLQRASLSRVLDAWRDLAQRPAGQVNGRKPVWAPNIAVNFIGPLAYFMRGRRVTPTQN